MIWPFLVAASVSTAPVTPTPSVPELLAGASHAVRVNRLDQARLMIARAVDAGASGPQLERVFADLAYVSGNYTVALSHYEALLKFAPKDQSLLEPAGISALKTGNVERAGILLSSATSLPGAGWRAWNALGAVADLKADWAKADECYDHASRLAPKEVGPVNNRGWSLTLRGSWAEAVEFFEQATALDPKSERIANNLELARSALATQLPSRQAGESDSAWAARLNDAGMAAAIMGDKARATAAFTEALGVNGTWYARAANNLEALGNR